MSIPELKGLNDSLYEFYSPPGPAKPQAEIIFFHDLHWNEYDKPFVQSWMTRSEPKICWPMVWLGEKYPKARILSASYDAGIWKTSTTGHMEIHQVAENFRQDILGMYEGDCPIFLVGHGLGGIIIKKFIRELQDKLTLLSIDSANTSKNSPNTSLLRLDCFLKNIKGVFFYATPFAGSTLAGYTKYFPYRGSLVECLELLRAESSQLNEWFRKWRQARGCRAKAVFAALPTMVSWWFVRWYTHVVKESSVRSDIDEMYSSASDHITVCQPRDQTDSGYRMLIRLLDEGMPMATATASEPVAEMENSAQSACSVILQRYISDGPKNEATFVRREHIAKLSEIPEMLDALEGYLRNCGLELSGRDETYDYWEPKQ